MRVRKPARAGRPRLTLLAIAGLLAAAGASAARLPRRALRQVAPAAAGGNKTGAIKVTTFTIPAKAPVVPPPRFSGKVPTASTNNNTVAAATTSPAADAEAQQKAEDDVAGAVFDALSPLNPAADGQPAGTVPLSAIPVAPYATAADDDYYVRGPSNTASSFVPYSYGPAVAVSQINGGYRPLAVPFYGGYGGWYGGGGYGWGRGWNRGGWGRGGWGRGGWGGGWGRGGGRGWRG